MAINDSQPPSHAAPVTSSVTTATATGKTATATATVTGKTATGNTATGNSTPWFSKVGTCDWVYTLLFVIAFGAALVYGSQDSKILTVLFGSLYGLAMILFALLMAYIAVMALRTLPQESRREEHSGQKTSELSGKPQSTSDTARSLAQTNLGRMAIAGLSGLAIFSALRPALDGAKAGQVTLSGDTFLLLYVFWFCLWFLVLLFWGARLNARNESRRVEQERRRRPHLLDSAEPSETRHRIERDADVVYRDTFAAYIQGRNQLETGSLAELLQVTEARYQALVTEMVNDLQNSVQTTVARALAKLSSKQPPRSTGRIRVAFSLLSESRDFALYLTSQSGSLRAPFKNKSIAVWCLVNRETRWVTLPDGRPPANKYLVSSEHNNREDYSLVGWFQDRDGIDYESFIVFPTYLKRNAGRRTAALHLSFELAEDMHLIFPKTRPVQNQNQDYDYTDWRKILAPNFDSADSEVAVVGAILSQVLLVLDGLVQELQDRLLAVRAGTPGVQI